MLSTSGGAGADTLRRAQFAAIEARRRRSMLYMVSVMMFLLVFDSRAHREHLMSQSARGVRTQSLRGSNAAGGGDHLYDASTAVPSKVAPFAHGLRAALLRSSPQGGVSGTTALAPFAANFSGRFHGDWGSSGRLSMLGGSLRRTIGGGDDGVAALSGVDESTLPRAQWRPGTDHGSMQMQLSTTPFAGTLDAGSIGVVRGLMQLQGTGGRYMLASAQGVFFGADGRLSLFINTQRNTTREAGLLRRAAQQKGGTANAGYGARMRAVQQSLDRLSVAWWEEKGGASTTPPPPATTPRHPRVGDPVAANWQNEGKIYEGKVTEITAGDTFTILYSDGDVEKLVPLALTNLSSSSTAAAATAAAAAAAAATTAASKRTRHVMDVTSLQPPRYHSGGLGEHCYFRAELRAMLEKKGRLDGIKMAYVGADCSFRSHTLGCA